MGPYTRVAHGDAFADGSATDLTVIIDAIEVGLEAVEAGRTRVVVTKTVNATLVQEDTILCNGAAMTLTLPTAVGITGHTFTIKNVNAVSLPLATTSSQTIDGAAPGTLAQWAYFTVMSDGANWVKV